MGYFDGIIEKIDTQTLQHPTKLPHMGWNTIEIIKNNDIFTDVNAAKEFYFLHSYCFLSDTSENTLAETTYGQKFASIVNRKNIYGMQFHPEKSHQNGIQLLKNFANIL